MSRTSPEVAAARTLTQQAAALLAGSPVFRQLGPSKQSEITLDLQRIGHALSASEATPDPYALALETPLDLARRRREGMLGQQGPGAPPPENAAPSTPKKQAATQAIAARTGALSDEIDFPGFVASLVQGTFDAIVDASIRQMEAFAELVSAVAKDLDRFTNENVTVNQARDHLVQAYPRELVLAFPNGQPRLQVRSSGDDFEEASSPSWLADYGLEGMELTDEMVENVLVPAARRNLGESRMQMLATMVLIGLNRVIVRDGTISAKVRFRASARDAARLRYAAAQDPGRTSWGGRGSASSMQSSMMVSTVGANVQAEADLKAELFGEVKINFASETLPLDQFVDAAQLALLQRNARTASPPGGTSGGEAQSSTGTNGSASALTPPAAPPPTTPPASAPPSGAPPSLPPSGT